MQKIKCMQKMYILAKNKKRKYGQSSVYTLFWDMCMYMRKCLWRSTVKIG